MGTTSSEAGMLGRRAMGPDGLNARAEGEGMRKRKRKRRPDMHQESTEMRTSGFDMRMRMACREESASRRRWRKSWMCSIFPCIKKRKHLIKGSVHRDCRLAGRSEFCKFLTSRCRFEARLLERCRQTTENAASRKRRPGSDRESYAVFNLVLYAVCALGIHVYRESLCFVRKS